MSSRDRYINIVLKCLLLIIIMSLFASLTRAKAKYVPPTIRIAFDTIVTKYVRPPAISFDTVTSKYIAPTTAPALSFDVIVSKYIKPLTFDVITSKYIAPTSYTITISNNTGSDVQTIVMADPKLATWGKNVRFVDDVGSLPSIFVYNGVWVVKLRNPLASGSSTTIKAYNMSPYIDPSIALAYLDFETDPAFTIEGDFGYVIELGFDGKCIKFYPPTGGGGFGIKSLPSAINAFRVLCIIRITGSANNTRGVVLRYDANNYYNFAYKFIAGSYYMSLEKVAGGSWAKIVDQVITANPYVLYGIRTGSSLIYRFLSNGSKAYELTATDTSITQFTQYGLMVYQSSGDYGYVDNLVVLPYEPDPTITVS